MKNILFLVNGLGLGNSTRCHSVIEKILLEKIGVTIATSGNGLNYFKANFPHLKVYELNAINYGKTGNELSFFKTLLGIPAIIVQIVKNQFFLFKIIKSQKIHLIVADSDYNLLPLALIIRCKIISINNSDGVLRSAFFAHGFPLKILPQLFIELADFIYQNIIASKIISPTFEPYTFWKKVHHVPVLVRSSFFKEQNKKDATDKKINVAIMLTGSGFFEDLSFIKTLPRDLRFKYFIIGREGESGENFTFLGKLMTNEKILSACDILIINAGFSAVSEAALLKNPVIILPVENHAEQYFNAKFIQETKLGLVANEKNLSQVFQQLVANLPKFKDNCEKVKFDENGSKLTAEIILENIS